MIYDSITVRSHGTIKPIRSQNLRVPYDHQVKAMECMDVIDQCPQYSTLVVLPTGGGKTYTASMWLLKNAIDRGVKVLWIAHRKMLLDQAAESFQRYAYQELIPHISGFDYRIISGSNEHERMIDINKKDNLLVVSKDSAGRNLAGLDKWLKGEKTIYFVIDEAHHATAKTYRKVIDYVSAKVPSVKMIGLTATPFRTGENEQGLLSKIFTDGVEDMNPVTGGKGITYEIGLKELINRQILSTPKFISRYTDELYGDSMGIDAWERIQRFDQLPEDIASKLANSAARNKLIVETYKENADTFGQTIVFALDVDHAIALNALFKKAKVKSDYIVSSVKDSVTGVTISQKENTEKEEAYRRGDLQVLINVNILTEGVDFPQTKTVFLARPTVSTILMTQMIGRALRGEKAGGTKEAYIVSFIDDWDGHIAWVNPESLFMDDGGVFQDNPTEKRSSETRMVAISKIEEFASILDDSVDTTKIESVPFVQRLPIGRYVFSYLENAEDSIDITWNIMVYDSTKKAYEEMMKHLPELFREYDIQDEYIPEDILYEMAACCERTFFLGEMIPPYEERDIIHVLKYYAQKEEVPRFITMDEFDRNSCDLAVIAKHIVDSDMRRSQQKAYIDSLWDNADQDIFRSLFPRKAYFLRLLDVELKKIEEPELFETDNVEYGTKQLTDMPLYEIRKHAPDYYRELTTAVYEKNMDQEGYYSCCHCGYRAKTRIPFQIDHIIPMSKGGQSVSENLQILCRRCNGEKGDRS